MSVSSVLLDVFFSLYIATTSLVSEYVTNTCTFPTPAILDSMSSKLCSKLYSLNSLLLLLILLSKFSANCLYEVSLLSWLFVSSFLSPQIVFIAIIVIINRIKNTTKFSIFLLLFPSVFFNIILLKLSILSLNISNLQITHLYVFFLLLLSIYYLNILLLI